MKKYIIIFTTMFLVSALFAIRPGNAQSRIITGVVYDKSDNSPLPGVNVLLKGTTTGIITDAYGKYEIKVPGQESILVSSYIGFVTQ